MNDFTLLAVATEWHGHPHCVLDQTHRRKGDNVKAQIQRLIARGKERDGRTEQESYQLLTTIMRDLGQFYSKNGPRARLEDGLREDILTRLEDAEQLLERHL